MLTSFWARIRARLIPDLRVSWRYWSVRILTFGAGLLAVWPEIPADVRDALPYANQIGALVVIAGLIARLVRQEPKA